MSHPNWLAVKVWGDFACFTRPEFGAERVSYEVMTPSAARGILEAIFWKPEFAWSIQEIWVLKPIRRFSIVRNEMTTWQSDRSAQSWSKEGIGGFYVEDDRAQRHTLCLRDVVYIIWADMNLKPHATDNIAKYRDQFRRRVKQGQCHHQPYLGTREFTAYFSEIDGTEQPIDWSDELGLMLQDVDFNEEVAGAIQYKTHDSTGSRITKGTAQPKFFRARLEKGILRIPR
ncbi:MAG: type I-C CRISPR-associated protein Cas5c [Cyanobacteriota bacterium]|nr:type I-C CRISPR-associated protein Cas5c [Cyanobacteriota bacterium]